MKHHQTIHIIVLFLILLSSLVSFYFARGNTHFQIIIGILTSIAYVVWGVVHHSIKRDLHRNIVIEYVLIGAIAIVLLLTVAI
jgi:hypothetical protein